MKPETININADVDETNAGSGAVIRLKETNISRV